MKHAALFLLLLAVLTGCRKEKPVPEAEASLQWKVYNRSNSPLPGNQVSAIAIDRQNNKWIGTAQGLVRIKGAEWTEYGEENSPLPSSFIRALAVDDKGVAWIGTDKGLARFDGVSWEVFHKENSPMTENAISCIAHDPARNRTWVATEKELVEIGENGTWKVSDALEDDLILSMAVDRAGALWMGTFNHVAFRGRIRKLADGTGTTFQLDKLGYPSTFPYSLAIEEQNTPVAVLTGTATKSVVRIEDGTVKELAPPLAIHGLRSIQAEGSRIWLGGDRLALLTKTGWTSILFPVHGAQTHTLAVDRQGNKWIGTVTDGVFVYGK